MKPQVFDDALDFLDQRLAAERLLACYQSVPTGEPPVVASRGIRPDLVWKASDVSLTVLARVLKEGAPVLTNTAWEDPERKLSAILGDVRAILCAPIYSQQGRVIGLIYADSKQGSGQFSPTDLALLSSVCRSLEETLSAGEPRGIIYGGSRPRGVRILPAASPSRPRSLGGRSERKEPEPEAWTARVRCSSNELALFARQLAVMFATGIPLVAALDTLSHQEDNPNFGRAIALLAQKIEGGQRFSAAMLTFPRLFHRVFVTMVAVGERTGGLATCLERVADWLERDSGTWKAVRSALTYPLLVALTAAVVAMLIFHTVMPGLLEIFEGQELPLLTQLVLLLTRLAQNPGNHLILFALVGLAAGRLRDYYQTPQGRLQVFSLALKVPLLGPLLREATAARFCAAAGVLLSAGLTITETLPLAAGASDNPLLQEDARELLGAIQQGEPMAAHLQDRPDCYPGIVPQLLTVGEESGRLAQMFEHCRRFLEEDLKARLETFSAALEPLLVGAVAVMVGTVVLSIFLPLYQMIAAFGP